MTSFSMTCAGTDITEYIELDSVIGQNDLTQRIDTLRFRANAIPNNLIHAKDEVIVTDNTGTKWFGGIVAYIDMVSESRETLWDVEVQGYGTLLDTALVNKIYSNTTDTAIIMDLLATYRPQITLDAAAQQQGLAIDQFSFPYKTLSNSLDDLCASTGYKYYVDPNKTLNYFYPVNNTPSLILSDTNPDNVSVYSYRDWKLRSDATQVQNRVTVLGVTAISGNITDTFTGDGSTTQFLMSHRPHQVAGVQVSGTPYNIGHVGIDQYGGALSVNVLIDDKQQLVEFQTAPSSGATISVLYNYDSPIIARSQLYQSDGVTPTYGQWYDGKVVDSTILTVSDAIGRANVTLSQYGWAQRTIWLKTIAPWTRAGLTVQVTNTVDGIIAQNFLVQMSRWTLLGNGIVLQELQLIG